MFEEMHNVRAMERGFVTHTREVNVNLFVHNEYIIAWKLPEISENVAEQNSDYLSEC